MAKRLVSGLVAGALALGGLALSGGTASAKTPVSPTTKRIAGDDRYETAVEVARAAIDAGAADNYLVIASGTSPYDALSASALAGVYSAPVVLNPADSLHPSVADLLDDNKAAFRSGGTGVGVFIVGGTSAISDDVKAAIEAIIQTGDTSPAFVTRIAGDDRYATAAAIANAPGVMQGSDRMIVVNGEDGRWADALSAASLSYINGWPIVLVRSSGIPASSEAVLESYLNKPASLDLSFIVGGPAVVTKATQEAMVTLGFSVSGMTVRGGVDRYQTNFLMNQAMLTVLGAPGAKVALVSGEAPWDALVSGPWAAATDSHVVMTNSASLNSNAQTLIGALAGDGVGLSDFLPNELWIVGGKSAVGEAVKTAAIATAQGTNLPAPTISGCFEGSDEIKLTFTKGITDQEVTAIDAGSDILGDGVIDTGNFDQDDAGLGLAADANKVVVIPLTTNLAEDDVFTFLGVLEASSDKDRAIAGASCTVAADNTRPSVTSFEAFTVDTDSDGVGDDFSHAYVKFSEAVTLQVGSGPFELAADCVGGDYSPGGDFEAYPLDSSGSWYVLYDGSPAALADGDVVTFNANENDLDADSTVGEVGDYCVLDAAGNAPSADYDVEAALDGDEATLVVALSQCSTVGTADASVTVGGLTMDAVGTLAGGAYGGTIGNDWKLAVVQQRGLLIPTVSVDSTAMVVTVTADVNYHSAADIITVAGNAGVTSNFEFAEATGGLAVSSGKRLTGGEINCEFVLVGSEQITSNTVSAFTVNGYDQSDLIAVDFGTSVTLDESTTVAWDLALTQVSATGLEHAGTANIVIEVEDPVGNPVEYNLTFAVG